MSGQPDDPHVRRLQNRVGTLENRIEYLEESQQLLVKYIQAVEQETIAEPALPDEVADRVEQLASGRDEPSSEEDSFDEGDGLFD